MSSDSISQFSKVAENPREWLRTFKDRTRKKVIGCFPLYGPEELIAASGMLPVLLQGSNTPIQLAEQHIYDNTCHPFKSNFDLALRGEYDFLDGLVVSSICEQSRRGSSLWKVCHSFPYHHNLIYPMALDTAAAKDYLVYELNRCRASLEGLAGHAIPSEAITESIKLFNRSRSLLGQLYGLRRQRPSAFSLEEIAQVMAASQIMPKEEFIPMLEDYLREKQNTVVVQDDKVPIFLACNQCEDLEPGLPQMLDSMGALVVDDDLYFGYRYFANSVAETGDPIVALCQAHLDLPACPTRHHRGRDWSQFLLNRARAAAAKGVVLILQKFCEIHIVHYPRLLNEFQKANMPLIMLESNHSGASGLTKTRLEAFLEMLRE